MNIQKKCIHICKLLILLSFLSFLLMCSNSCINTFILNKEVNGDTIFRLHIKNYYSDCFAGGYSEEMYSLLIPVIEYLNAHDIVECEIGLFSTCLAHDSINERINLERGERIKSIMISNGIDPQSIVVVSYGSRIPYIIRSDTMSFPKNTVIDCDYIRSIDSNYKNSQQITRLTREAYSLMDRIEIKILINVSK